MNNLIEKNEITLIEDQSLPKNFFEGKELGIIKVLTNLVNQVTKELQQANKILEDQKCTIEQMDNVKKSIMEINTQILTSCEIDSLFQLILEKALDLIPKGKFGSILFMEDNALCYKATMGYSLDKIKEITYGH